MPLRLRLALLFGLGTAIVIAVASLAFLGQLRASLNNAVDDTLKARAGALTAKLASTHILPPPLQRPQPPPPRPAPSPRPSGERQGNNQSVTGPEDVRQVLRQDGTVLTYSPSAGPRPLLTRTQLAQAGRKPLTITEPIDGEPVRVLAVPAHSGTLPVVALVGINADITQKTLLRAQTIIWRAGPPIVVVASFGAWLLAGAALRPVGRMRRRLTEITEQDTGARLQVPGSRDEIAALAVAMNGLLDRLQRALARQRGFVADAGHELRTPLTALRAELELAARPGRSPQALADAVKAATGDAERLVRLAEDLLLLARADEGEVFLRRARVVLAEVAADSVQGVVAAAEQRDLAVKLDADESLSVVADRDRIRQAVDNLLDNAIRHAPLGSRIDVSVRQKELMAVIEVRDQGPGFPPEFLPHAFERFRRADTGRARSGGGVGLGLAIVASIARAHGGQAYAENLPIRGTRVRINLPCG